MDIVSNGVSMPITDLYSIYDSVSASVVYLRFSAF